MTALGHQTSFVTGIIRGIPCYKPSEVPQHPQAAAVPAPSPAPAAVPSAPCRPRKRTHEEVTNREREEPGSPRKTFKRPGKQWTEPAKVTRLGHWASFITRIIRGFRCPRALEMVHPPQPVAVPVLMPAFIPVFMPLAPPQPQKGPHSPEDDGPPAKRKKISDMEGPATGQVRPVEAAFHGSSSSHLTAIQSHATPHRHGQPSDPSDQKELGQEGETAPGSGDNAAK
ncbi:uncharacterized protein LOC119920760 [Tachyglossus aculeatus]|uniref:uncharacterized protein LOC119920760 n=1 Tax=Tachyglossus aculeatus TaxID=9261 RepID=UPI0018F6FFB1|nr:uncharacterized protein LOC119920760 [Tachyglossus aculeatus]